VLNNPPFFENRIYDKNQLLTLRELSKMSGMNFAPRSMRRWIKEEGFPALWRRGKWLVDPIAAENWLKEHSKKWH
jgi:hypothetical protein